VHVHQESERDFLISYTAVDEVWSQWIAVELRLDGLLEFAVVLGHRRYDELRVRPRLAMLRNEEPVDLRFEVKT
jgi:hypothetical protein